MTRFLLICLLGFNISQAQQRPDWVENNGKSSRYSSSRYLTGFSLSSKVDELSYEDKRTAAINNSRSSLAEKILVSIKSKSEFYSLDSKGEYEEFVESITSSESELEIPGLNHEIYYDKRKNIIYCLSYVERSKFKEYCTNQLDELSENINATYAYAKQMEAERKRTRALKKYLTIQVLFEKFNNLKALLVGINVNYEENVDIRKYEVNDAIDRLADIPAENVESLLDYFVFVLKQYFDQPVENIVIAPFTYVESGFASDFSLYFKGLLEGQINRELDWKTLDIEYIRAMNDPFLLEYSLRGSYYPIDDDIMFNLFVKEVATNKKLFSTTKKIPKSALDQFNIIPKNYQIKENEREFISKNQVAKNGLSLEAWTNKGKEDLVFYDGELIQIILRSNLPCFIRVINYTIDGDVVLLIDNIEIDSDMTNQAYELPQLECTDPYGPERIQFLAKTTKFEPVITENINGIRYINKSKEEVMESFKDESDEDEYKDEETLLFTTYGKNK